MTITHLATSGAPTFTGAGGTSLPPDGTDFTLLQTAVKTTSTSITADTATNSQGVTLTVQHIGGPTDVELRFSVPSLNIQNLALTDAGATATGEAFTATTTDGKTLTVVLNTLDYVAAGYWLVSNGPPVTGSIVNSGAGISGYVMPANAVTTGSALYAGGVIGLVAKAQGTGQIGGSVIGAATLQVSFPTGQVSGFTTGMSAIPNGGGSAQSWNEFTLSGTLAGATISGATTADKGEALASPLALSTTATGAFTGNLYGPTGQDIGLVWNLYDGAAGAMGVIAGEQTSTSATSGGQSVVQAFAGATTGQASVSFPVATVGGYRLNSSGPPAQIGLALPLDQTAVGTEGIPVTGQLPVIGSAVQTDLNGATLKLQATNASQGQPVELIVPQFGIDVTLANDGSQVVQSANGKWGHVNILPSSLRSTLVGEWDVAASSSGPPIQTGWFTTGLATATGAMPTTGSATYIGTGNMQGEVYSPTPDSGSTLSYGHALLTGSASLTANFATGAVSGALTQTAAFDIEQPSVAPWNNVTLSGSISGAGFQGTTTTSTNPGGLFGFNAGSGTLSGKFYGPAADEVGAVWTLTDGVRSAVGVFSGAPALSPTPTPTPTVAATIGAPAAATVGTSAPTTTAQGFQTAQPGGPTLNDSGTPPAPGTVFALTQTSMTIGASAITADTATNAAGATATVVNAGNYQVEVKIPGVGIDSVVQLGSQLAVEFPSDVQLTNGKWFGAELQTNGSVSPLNYTLLGNWQVKQSDDINPTNYGEWVAGYQTPTSAMPHTGGATYSLANGVNGVVFVPTINSTTGQAYSKYILYGGVTLAANFATGAVNGSFTNMTVQGGSTWNDVTLTATIAGANFSGTTAAANGGNGSGAAMAAGAAGTINGGFYGPSADEVGAVWTLSDGTRSAIGTVGAPKQTAPSDRRLKRDITPLGRLANGVALYSFRYRGDDRAFVGAMAQDLLADPRFAAAVHRLANGFLVVDYARLGFAPQDIEGMRRAGEKAMRLARAAA